jgi:hypothetical protein
MAVPFPCVAERLGHFVAERRDVADVTLNIPGVKKETAANCLAAVSLALEPYWAFTI